jgi:hypothetical protein
VSKRQDTATMAAVRRGHQPRRSFLKHEEFRRLRAGVLRITQTILARALISPDTGAPIGVSTVSRWEAGEFAIPLWAAKRIRQMVIAAAEEEKEAQ